mgnify:CR=1 FL=1|jgi:hypothetical protein
MAMILFLLPSERSETLVIWEWAYDPARTVQGNPDTFFEGLFVSGEDSTNDVLFAVNNEYRPTFHLSINEVVHFRLLCAQVLRKYGWGDHVI